MTNLIKFASPTGRALLVSVFLLSGLNKLGAIEATQGYMASVGLPGFMLFPAIALEIVAPLAIVAGFYSRLAAFLLAGFSIMTAFLFHTDFADQIQVIMFSKNIALAGGLLFLVSTGPGALSVNNK